MKHSPGGTLGRRWNRHAQDRRSGPCQVLPETSERAEYRHWERRADRVHRIRLVASGVNVPVGRMDHDSYRSICVECQNFVFIHVLECRQGL